MLVKVAKLSVMAAITVTAISAANFNAQAEKDKKALTTYMEAKFKNPAQNRKFFPYTTKKELSKFTSGLKGADFSIGTSVKVVAVSGTDLMVKAL